jgi:hypothetical protein
MTNKRVLGRFAVPDETGAQKYREREVNAGQYVVLKRK